MRIARQEACTHPACTCVVSSGRYCSTACESGEETPEADCPCEHTGCKGSKHSLASSAFEIQARIHQRRSMKKHRVSLATISLLAISTFAGCFGSNTKSPDVADNVRRSLDQAGLKDVSVSQDRDKGIVTLGGHVASEYDKSQAESLTKVLAGEQVVADQIAVIPPGAERDAKAVNSDLDSGIEKNLDAALIQNQMHDIVKYDVKSGVVTLTGEVNSQRRRDHAQQVATRVPNVKQVVNDLQVKNQKASSSE